MFIFPSRAYALRSPLKPEQAEEALRKSLSPKRSFRERFSRKMGGGFTGDVGGGTFKIERDINYRNSFLPLVTGVIAPGERGSRIDVKLGLHPLVVAFTLVWLGFIGMVGVPMVTAMMNGTLQTQGDSRFALFIPLGMLLFGLILPHAAFYTEANKADAFLADTFKAERDLPPDPNRAL